MQIPDPLLLLLLVVAAAAGILLVDGGWWPMAAPLRCLAVSGPCYCCLAGRPHEGGESGAAAARLGGVAWCGVVPLPACMLTCCLRRVLGATG